MFSSSNYNIGKMDIDVAQPFRYQSCVYENFERGKKEKRGK